MKAISSIAKYINKNDYYQIYYKYTFYSFKPDTLEQRHQKYN